MLSYILCGLYLAAILAAAATGNLRAGNSVMEGAAQAVRFCLTLIGPLCLWSGALELLERCGGAAALSRLLRPLLGRLFPLSAGDEAAFSALTENVSANLLGLGNAATPAGVRCVQRMAAIGATDELGLFTVLNTASIQLLPTTIASLRAAAGARSPFDILPAVLLASLLSVIAGLTAAFVLRRLRP